MNYKIRARETFQQRQILTIDKMIANVIILSIGLVCIQHSSKYT